MREGNQLGQFEALVLTAVLRLREGANGTAIYEEIEARSGRAISLPAVHVTLRRLEEKRLLASRDGGSSPRGGRPQRFYRATPNGVRALREFRDVWQKVWSGLDLPDPEALS